MFQVAGTALAQTLRGAAMQQAGGALGQVPGGLANIRDSFSQAIGFRRRKRPQPIDYDKNFAPVSATNSSFAGLTSGMDKYGAGQASQVEQGARAQDNQRLANSANDPRIAAYQAQDPMLGAINGRRLRVMSKGA